MDEKQTNEDSPTAAASWAQTLRKRSFKPKKGQAGTEVLTGQGKGNPVVGGKRMQVAHTTYDRIGGLIREFIVAKAAYRAAKKYVQGDPNAPKKPSSAGSWGGPPGGGTGVQMTGGGPATSKSAGTNITGTGKPTEPEFKSKKPEEKKPEEKKPKEEEEGPKKAGMFQRLIRGQNPYTQKHDPGTAYRG